MKCRTTAYKRMGSAIIIGLLVTMSFNPAPQKGVYDVIAGSGPSKTRRAPQPRNTGSGPNINRRHQGREGDHHGDNDREFKARRRKHLPPGQAKKIYGGSAKEYAPGQQRKREHNEGGDRHDDSRGERKGKHKDHG
jgi:hypothetical protein